MHFHLVLICTVVWDMNKTENNYHILTTTHTTQSNSRNPAQFLQPNPTLATQSNSIWPHLIKHQTIVQCNIWNTKNHNPPKPSQEFEIIFSSSLISSDRSVVNAHSLVLAAVSPHLASLLSADAADPEGDGNADDRDNKVTSRWMRIAMIIMMSVAASIMYHSAPVHCTALLTVNGITWQIAADPDTYWRF